MLDKLIEILPIPIIPCQEATRLMSLSMDRPLTLKEKIQLRLHWAVCNLCVRFGKHLTAMRTLLRSYATKLPAPHAHLSDAAKSTIKTNLQK